VTVKAEQAETAGVLSPLEADEPPDFGLPVHIHHDAAEAFYVLSGEYSVVVDDETHRCSSRPACRTASASVRYGTGS
jgi:mannose-6-phosphate isomerase-like protein (cupin superfamily)